MLPRDLALHAYWRSSASWRVRIALALKGLRYRYLPVHLRDGVQHSDHHTQVNPMAQVPVLSWDEGGTRRSLTQSLAIIELLEEWAPSPALLPGPATTRARVRQLAELVNSGVQPLQNFAVLMRVQNELGGDRAAWGRYWIERGLAALERELARPVGPAAAPGDFLVGDQPTLADLCLVPQLYNARRFRCDLSGLPRLLDIEARAAALPAFQQAHPDAQPDAEG